MEVEVVYHNEGSCWWAEAPSEPGFTAAGNSLAEVREEVRGGLEFLLGTEPEILEAMADGRLVVEVTGQPPFQGSWSAGGTCTQVISQSVLAGAA